MPQGPSFWFDTRIYLAVAAALLVVIVFYNHYVAVLGAILLYVLYLYGRERYVERQKALNDYLEAVTRSVDEASLFALQTLPLAIAVVDKNGVLHWHNKTLTEWGGDPLAAGGSILSLWPDLSLVDIWGRAGEMTVKAADRSFRLIFRPLVQQCHDADDFMILYATDVTAEEELRRQCETARTVIVVIQIDNYDDVLKGMDENQRTAILSEINRRLGEWVSQFDGFFKRYTEDMYLAVFNHQSLQDILQDKVDILDRIRAIHADNKIPVTLSIGIAADEPSIAALGQRAQAGIDLALGRGGDQAAVYVEGKVQFYGGKAKAVEKSTRVKARIVAQAIHELIGDADSVLVMGHVGEDFDSLGAALGVAKMARQLGKPVHVIISQSNIAVGKMTDILADYKEYRDIFITPDEAENFRTDNSLLFVVDTHRPELAAAPALLSGADRAIVIDHHRRAEVFIANPLLVYLEPSASSTSELVTELLMYFEDRLDLTRAEASALYAGIVVDTKNFAVQTGVRTFEAASYLRRSGADPSVVRFLFRMDFATLKAQAGIIAQTEMFEDGVLIAVCPPDLKNAQVIAAQSADMLLTIEGVRVSYVLFFLEGGGTGISARSQGDINVQVIMEQIGGGGHQTVAGAQLRGMAPEEIKRQLVELTVKYIRESEAHESNLAARSEKSR